METEYLKRCFGNSLTQALEEVAKVRPSDPIEYLAYWLYHYRKTSKAKEEKRKEEIQLKEEYDNSLKENKTTEMLKQEEYLLQQRDEQRHKVGEELSTEKTQSMQENTKLLEKEALEKESLPSSSIMTPEEPQEIFQSFKQTNYNLKTPEEIN
ncbi:PREDICTED: DPY30 domain-containing protein 2 [Condylura cristata]|uniref:DPY30 domain-containing protein 2 n=1 Tax=Condylura cristata TaxID=143302 RepID=UPI0006439E31|nr:PREDICTED: DPY30 domain-containing protein 2 [Condylura cristata]